MRRSILHCSLIGLLTATSFIRADERDDLWSAARKGDAKAVKALLEKGVDVNASTTYGATALWFAAMNGKTDVIKLLLEHHAQTDLRDGIWNTSALGVAESFDHLDSIATLLRAGAGGADALAISAVTSGNPKLLRVVLDAAKVQPEALSAALFLAPAGGNEMRDLLTKAGAQPFAKPLGDPGQLKPLEGDYEEIRGGRLRMHVKNGFLVEQFGGRDVYVLKPVGELRFEPIGQPSESFVFERTGNEITKVLYRRGANETPYLRGKTLEANISAENKLDEQPQAPSAPGNWPSFRGDHASGVADGQHLPATWDVAKGRNILWKAALPGLAHSSPIVWNGKIFVTTAVSSDPKSELKVGLYGSGDSAKDVSSHEWRVLCLEAATGKTLWERTAHSGVPRVKRHMKSTHANPTPATDGKHLVVSFASEGLYCYDLDGNFLWKQDLGVIDDGAFNAPELQWGAASSPVLFRDLGIILCDRQKESFMAAYNLDTGKPVWRVDRDEIPSWGTPNIWEGPPHPELIVNGTHYIRGYDPLSGKELWRLGPNSQITTPTPIFGDGLIFVTNGYHPIQPIYAIRPGASGDISPKEGEAANTYVAWSKKRGGPYTPTPIVYDHRFYACTNIGILSCYDDRTGAEIYRKRLGGSSGYSASPVAADGKIYLAGENGEIRVVKAGPAFELLAINKMDDPCMATPAIADGMLLVRTQHSLYAIGWQNLARNGRK
jgi:outer membrane protein assembly factor BamB